MNKFESPAMTAQATIRASVLKYTALLCKSLEDNYNRKHTNRAGQLQYSIRTGRKYHKIVEGEGSAHAFVDKNTGRYINLLVGHHLQRELGLIFASLRIANGYMKMPNLPAVIFTTMLNYSSQDTFNDIFNMVG